MRERSSGQFPLVNDGFGITDSLSGPFITDLSRSRFRHAHASLRHPYRRHSSAGAASQQSLADHVRAHRIGGLFRRCSCSELRQGLPRCHCAFPQPASVSCISPATPDQKSRAILPPRRTPQGQGAAGLEGGPCGCERSAPVQSIHGGYAIACHNGCEYATSSRTRDY